MITCDDECGLIFLLYILLNDANSGWIIQGSLLCYTESTRNGILCVGNFMGLALFCNFGVWDMYAHTFM